MFVILRITNGRETDPYPYSCDLGNDTVFGTGGAVLLKKMEIYSRLLYNDQNEQTGGS